MIINISNIVKTYPENQTPAVNGVSFEVEQGQIITLLGPSGCGKTTLLRLIAGLERPDSGEISVKGEIVSGKNHWVSPEKRGVGMVFQDYALFPHLRVSQNIGFGIVGKDKKRIRETLELVALDGYQDKYPAQLSGGQQQRVALARALAGNPVVVLLDEPFSNLDVNLRKQMRQDVVRIIHKSNTTAIFVTHDQKEALAISDKIIVMREGKVEQIGTPRQIYETPRTRFVASFVSQSNILEGILSLDGKSVLTDIGALLCSHNGSKKPGEKVTVSLSPDSFKLNKDGTVRAKIEEVLYTGDNVDIMAIVEVTGNSHQLSIHLPPETRIKRGQEVTFRVLPKCVPIIEDT